MDIGTDIERGIDFAWQSPQADAPDMPNAVVILSGGLDSTTCLAIARDAGYRVFALTFDYGQRHRVELEAAKSVAGHYQVAEHQIAKLPFYGLFGGSALTDMNLEVPRQGLITDGIPITYVPGRNLVFLSVAVAYAEVVKAEAVFLGVNALDYSGYPDCRPEFVRAFEQAARLATKTGVEGQDLHIETPLLALTKAEIIRWGAKLGVPYYLTQSCYNGEEVACGECDSCRLRLKGFAEAGIADPIPYRSERSTQAD